MAEKTNIKKRSYQEDYLKFGFTSIVTNGIAKPQCVICLKVLSAESMKPFQLKRHFVKEHANFTEKKKSSNKHLSLKYYWKGFVRISKFVKGVVW